MICLCFICVKMKEKKSFGLLNYSGERSLTVKLQFLSLFSFMDKVLFCSQVGLKFLVNHPPTVS